MRQILRMRFVGDAARIYVNSSLVQDCFYNGDEKYGLMLGVQRHSPAIFEHGFDLHILPLRSDAPIYLSSPPLPNQVAEVLGFDVLQTADINRSFEAT